MKAEFRSTLGSGLGDGLSSRGKSLRGGRSRNWASSFWEWNKRVTNRTKESERIIAVTNRIDVLYVWLNKCYSILSKGITLLTISARTEILNRPPSAGDGFTSYHQEVSRVRWHHWASGFEYEILSEFIVEVRRRQKKVMLRPFAAYSLLARL